MRKAWIVVYIDTSTSPATVRGAGVFSDPDPTTLGQMRTLPYMEFTGEDYEAAAYEAERYLLRQPMAWAGPLSATKSRLSRQWPREVRPNLPSWAKCLLLNLASVVWFAAGQQAENEMMVTTMLGHSYWSASPAKRMSGDADAYAWNVNRHLLEASNPLYVEGGYGK